MYLSDDATETELLEAAEETRLNQERERARKRVHITIARRNDFDNGFDIEYSVINRLPESA